MKQTIECNHDMLTLYNRAVNLKRFINEYEQKVQDAYDEFDRIQEKLIDLDEKLNDNDWSRLFLSGFKEMQVRSNRFEDKYSIIQDI